MSASPAPVRQAPPVPVRLLGESESGKAYKAAVAVAPRRLRQAAETGIGTLTVFIPKSGVRKSADGTPRLKDGMASAEAWTMQGKVRRGLLTAAKAEQIVARASESMTAGAYSLVANEGHTSDSIRVVAEAPATPVGAAYLAKMAKGREDELRILRTSSPVDWRDIADIVDGRKVSAEQIEPAQLDAENPGWSVCRVADIAPPAPEAPQADAPEMDDGIDPETAARLSQLDANEAAGRAAQPEPSANPALGM